MSVLPPGCCFDEPVALMPFAAARAAALALVQPTGRTLSVPLASARGQIAARPVVAPHSLPPFDQAAMDGYAIRIADLRPPASTLPVSGTTEAGDEPGRMARGTAHRVMTGAALPQGADTVVMLERTWNPDGDRVTFASPPVAGSHIRRASEDVRAGDVVIHSGERLGWPQIALLAGLGIDTVIIAAPIHIAVLTTGSELRSPGEVLAAGAIHDANGPMLAALLAEASARISVTTIGDDCAAIARSLEELAEGADLIVTTAGMSVGARDHVRDAVRAAGGTLGIVKVAMKPGKPVALGRIGGAVFVGLPGNPQAAACAALAFVRPIIDAMRGQKARSPVMAIAGFATGARTDDRTELVPVRLRIGHGRLVAERAGAEGSHRLAPMAAADAMAIIEPLRQLEIGDPVEILPFERAPAWRE
ncbi:MAG TPA: gephyrin-like molybdotransferase Glp [Kaistia sp.]|nr:gephyrin-like molybdotransferase Glp [Kaistia sp.]